MKVLFACLALTLVVGVSSSEARWFGIIGKKRCLPRAIDSPIVRQHVKEYHKAGNHQRHPGPC
jgi:hypothetical protein